ncbi:TIGR00730 family Rossman fold protein [Synechococcus sp. RSCCF101]|uniref:LOG family protein n=1 Tax=Synechococcus sp. RSCCF101 TaxID=2511069 RepID=UPI00177ED20C|nr:TIGR00730 family Rossman fold protein [Synechococcus sp. RSCCF101]
MELFRNASGRRRIAVFGSARSPAYGSAYRQACHLGQLAAANGFDVITGAGPGIMEAANRGAGQDHSFGVNVRLPEEQVANRYLDATNQRLLTCHYFFTRKLFFLRESDALVICPGGFGTLDEMFESLTLIQTGRTPPIPVVLMAPEADGSWLRLQRRILEQLRGNGHIAAEDEALLRFCTDPEQVIERIRHFYRLLHSIHRSGDTMALHLHAALPQTAIHRFSREFDELFRCSSPERLEHGWLHSDPEATPLFRLRFRFDERRIGLLVRAIDWLNDLELADAPDAACQSDPTRPGTIGS